MVSIPKQTKKKLYKIIKTNLYTQIVGFVLVTVYVFDL